jgi:hypothetical protein
MGLSRENVPAGNSEAGASSRVSARASQTSVRDGRAGWDGSRKLHDGNIIVVCTGGVGGVDLDGRNLDKGSTGGTALVYPLA